MGRRLIQALSVVGFLFSCFLHPLPAADGVSAGILDLARTGLPEYRLQNLSPNAFPPATDTWQSVDWRSSLPTALLRGPMTIDVDPYVAERIPEPIRRIARTPGVQVIVAGGLWPETAAAMPRWGWRPIFGLVRQRDVNSKAYLFGRHRDGRWALVVTNIFGRDRLHHLFLEYAFLLGRPVPSPAARVPPPPRHPLPKPAAAGTPGPAPALSNLAGLELQEPPAFGELDRRLCANSLTDLVARPDDVVVLGYQSSFNIVAWYVAAFAPTGRPWTPAAFLEWKKTVPRPVSFPKPAVGGNAYYPRWEYSLPGPDGRTARFLSWRNLYGDAAGTLMAELIQRGFQRFIVFGNAGGLSERTLQGRIYSPVVVTLGSASVPLVNRAAIRYPPRTVLAVASILEESVAWLGRHRNRFDLVEVEHVSMARALQGVDGIFLYSGLLVSDRPGEHDLTRFDESTPEIIEAKDTFLFEAIRAAFESEP